MPFKVGQKVVVLRAYYGGSNAIGVVVKPGKAREYEGLWWVDIGDNLMPVEPERLRDFDEYWAEERKKRQDE